MGSSFLIQSQFSFRSLHFRCWKVTLKFLLEHHMGIFINEEQCLYQKQKAELSVSISIFGSG